jgi:hypothetical protein
METVSLRSRERIGESVPHVGIPSRDRKGAFSKQAHAVFKGVRAH